MTTPRSRIPHPSGGRILLIHHWAVMALGFSGAAVLGVLDFFDRLQAKPQQFICTRTRLIADLEGVVGKNKVDEALARLMKLGWVLRRQETLWGRSNLQTRHQYALCADAVAEFLLGSGICHIPEPKGRKNQNRDLAGSRNQEAINKQGVDKGAEAPADSIATAKSYRRRPSGIICWLPDDEQKAQEIESATPADCIEAAIDRLVDCGKEPVPGLVLREILHQKHEAKIVEQRRVADQRYAAMLSVPPIGSGDHAAFARGLARIEKIRRNKLWPQADGTEEGGAS